MQPLSPVLWKVVADTLRHAGTGRGQGCHRKGVMSILDPQEIPRPARRVLGEDALEGSLHLLVVSLCLAISFQVEARRETHCRPESLVKLFTEVRGELGTPIWNYILWKTIELRNMSQNCLCCLHRWRQLWQSNKMCQFWKLVSNSKNDHLTLRRRQSCDKVQRKFYQGCQGPGKGPSSPAGGCWVMSNHQGSGPSVCTLYFPLYIPSDRPIMQSWGRMCPMCSSSF